MSQRLRLCFDRGNDCPTFRVLAVPEVVLLRVGGPEDVVSGSLDGEHTRNGDRGELGRVEGEVAGLKCVGEGDPAEIANRQHEAEAVGDDIHGGEQSGLRGMGSKVESAFESWREGCTGELTSL